MPADDEERIALFLDYERVPNVYDPDVYVHLNHLRA